MNKIFDKIKNFLRKFFGLYIIDENKPVPFSQQVLVTGTILAVTCIAFTIMYLCSYSKSVISVNMDETSQTSTSSVTKEVSETEQVSKSESSDENSKEESKEESSNTEESEESMDTAAMLGNMTTVLKTTDDLHRGELILVNKELSCRYDGENAEPMADTKSGSYVLVDNNVSLAPDVTLKLNDMMDTFEAIYGENDVMVACGYRDYNTQAHLYFEEIDKKGQEEAEKSVAPPGYSEHQTGYTFDLDLNIEGDAGINYDGDGIYSWINENCSDYGFIIRYVEGKDEITGFMYEPWHFRYVGVPHSIYMTKNNMVLEEYLDFLQKYTSNSPLYIKDDEDNEWLIYYVAESNDYETEIPVPQDKEYSISGDNYSGFIVTVSN